MSETVKVTISLPRELLELVERERHETRSELFRRAVESWLAQRRKKGAVDRYVQGYLDHPETEKEGLESWGRAQSSLAAEPWE